MQTLTRLIYHFIANKLWPTVWNSSNITPWFKKANEADKIYYSPVSILPALSKIYENKVVADQMYSEFSPSLSPNLAAYLKGHSCCTATLKMVED